MRAETILQVLMEDKKYKAKVEELRALVAELSELRTIASTLEAAHKMESAARDQEAKNRAYEKELSELFERKIKELNDQAKAKTLELEERAAKERERYKLVRDEAKAIELARKEVEKLLAKLEERAKIVQTHEDQVVAKQTELLRKVQKVNEVFNG